MLTLVPKSIHHFNNNLPFKLGLGECVYDTNLRELKLEDLEFETAWAIQRHAASAE